MDDPNIDGYETYCIGKMDAYCKELEAKNAELENQLKLSNEFVDIWRDKAIELEKKLEAVEMVHSNYVNVSCDLYFTLEKKLHEANMRSAPELEKKLGIACEALEKYADKKNWHYNSTNTVCSTGHQAHGYNVFIFENDCEKQDDNIKEMNVFSGCLAREALSKIKSGGL